MLGFDRIILVSFCIILFSACQESVTDSKESDTIRSETDISNKNRIKFPKGTHVEDIANTYSVTIQSILDKNIDLKYALEESQILHVNSKKGSAKHTVENGQSLSSIAMQYKIGVDDILIDNPSMVLVLTEDQFVNIPLKEAKSFERVHDVAHKENLFSIAKKYDVSVDEVVKANPETVKSLDEGQKYYIKNPKTNKNEEHFVKKGENLWTIARDNNIRVESLLKDNPDFINELSYGDQINLPEVSHLDDQDKTILGEDITKRGDSEEDLKNAEEFENILASEMEEVADSNAVTEEVNPDETNGDNHIRCGIPIKELKKIYGSRLIDRTYTDDKGNHSVFWLVDPKKDETFDLDIRFFANCDENDDCIVSKVVVEDDDYLFHKGIHVKSTIADVKQRFTNPVVEVLANSLVVFPDKKVKICFVLEAFSIEWRENGEYTVEDIPDNTEIVSIHLF
ncbi:MAG: LysM peptidoglycan-binding domain-containing protein [Flavobacteriales bacterium]|nr:LysM peptidoglycan-binding domain-containing protein [Flavobacteriales bacterium]